MKRFLPYLFLVAFVGCSTVDDVGSPLPRQSRAYKLSKLAVYAGGTADLLRSPEHRPAYIQANQGISALVAQEKWDLTSLAGALSAAGVSEVNTPEATLILQGGVLLIDLFTGQPVDLSHNWQAREIILGAHDGLQLVLARPATADSGTPGLASRVFRSDPVYEHLLNEARESRPEK